jgi:hypothetical protein
MSRAVALLLLFAPLAAGQVPVEPIPELPGGQSVSRPIQAVLPEERVIPPADLPPAEPVAEAPPRPLQRTWLSVDYLMQWTQGTTLPTLATGNMFGNPVLGDPNTVPLLGGRQSRGAIEGLRVVYGRMDNDRRGWEVGYHFLGSRTDRAVIGGGGLPGEAVLGRPLVNAATGREDVVLIAHPQMLGELEVNQPLRLTGWEVATLRQVYANEWARFTGLLGYRYFQVNEGLRFDQRSEYLGPVPGGSGVATYRSATADQIDAHNRFHGGTLGLRSQFEYAGFFAQLDTKVSLGRTTEVVKVSGQTVSTITAANGVTTSYFPNGVYGQPSNTGRTARGAFAVLPEANVRVGFAFTDSARLFVGYQFSYLSEVVRAADQLDRVVELGQTAGDLFGRPRVPFHRTDFWVQGVTLGLEWRY